MYALRCYRAGVDYAAKMIQNMDIQSLLVFTVVFIVVYLYWTTRLPENYPPGPRRVPIIGNLNIFAQNPKNAHKITEKLFKQYGPVVGLKFGNVPVVILSGMKVIREALVTKSDVFSDRPSMYVPYTINGINGKIHGIIFNNGESWKHIRRFVLTALRDFGMGKQSIEQRIQEEGDMICRELQKFHGHPTNVATLFQQAVSNIICSVCFGSRFEYSDPEFINLVTILNYNLSNSLLLSPVNFIPLLQLYPNESGLRKSMDNFDDIKSFIRRKIEEHRGTFITGQPRDFVDLYLEYELKGDSEIKFTIHDIEIAIFNLFNAGTETTSTSLRWLLLYMIHHPDVQTKCQQELDRIVGSERSPSLSDPVNMPYVMATIQEVQRLASIVPLALPHCARESTTFRGFHIPRNTIVFPSLYSVHMDSEYWEAPDEFRPERWIGPDGKVEKKENFIPFSVGPRVCLGEVLAKNEMFLFFTSVLQKFTVKMVDPSNPPSLEGYTGITLAPAPYKIIFLQR